MDSEQPALLPLAQMSSINEAVAQVVEENLKEQIKTNARAAMGGMGMGGMNMGMALGMQGPPQMPKTAPKATAGGSPAEGTRKKARRTSA